MFRSVVKPARHVPGGTFERYETRPPAPQNAVDAVPGWRTALPGEVGVAAGDLALVDDPRVSWAIETLGGIDGCRVLELGPLDGGHTVMLHKAGAERIDAVEANRLAFLRCLVMKELMSLTRAHFHLGDFSAGLGTASGRYDLVVASGVLYHMADPIGLLERLSGVTNRLFIWTHLVDGQAMPPGDARRTAFTGRTESRARGHLRLRLHERGYHGSEQDVEFCGGARDRHMWLEREGLLDLLVDLGFSDLRLGHDAPDAPGGPALSICALRPATASG